MKIAPIIRAITTASEQGKNISYRLVHTGQHYDKRMSDTFFEELQIPHPHANLESGGGSQAVQTANIMMRFEQELLDNPADLVLVVGDVTSTMACSIVAKKLQTKVAHVEAGIRSWDLTMPEEINRMVTDAITDYFFTTSHIANQNLRNAGIPESRIFFVGNTMIDTLLFNLHKLRKPSFWDELGLQPGQYLVITLHRPSNVDAKEQLQSILQYISSNTQELPIIFPVHPRTAKMLADYQISVENMHTVEPMSYLEFNYLVKNAKAVITDSGGITEETTVMGVPCMTLRDSTERPETITHGTNELVGTNPRDLAPALQKLMVGDWKKGSIPELWDGKTADRIVDILTSL